jgi:glycogen synthase
MNIGIITNEYPPNVYGGAGVHVEYLSRELSRLDNGKHKVKVFCFGKQEENKNNLLVKGINSEFQYPVKDEKHRKFLDTILKDIVITGNIDDVDIVHCHTWYSHFAGLLVKQLLQAPLILTTHSLEPHRPWKVEQLGTAYYGSSWIEKTAYENADGVVAVSEAMKNDVHNLYNVDFEKIRVIHNGIDLEQYRPTFNEAVLDKYKIDKNIPFILFVGRITRQKGIIHLVNAIKYLKEDIQIVLCAGAPDTKEIGIEMQEKVKEAISKTKNKIVWIPEMLPKDEVIVLYSTAKIFVCPSVYEPFGIINLEAMACETPVVATDVGGIPEVVINNETGILVPLENKENIEKINSEKFSKDLAVAINTLLLKPEKIKEMGIKSRKRVEEHFSWASIAKKTLEFYNYVLERYKKEKNGR